MTENARLSVRRSGCRSRYGGILFWLFLAIVALCSALLWGLLMWEFFVKGFENVPATEIDKNHS